MAGRGRGVSLSSGEKTVSMNPVPAPESLAKAVKAAAETEGISESAWRRDAYTRKLDSRKPKPLE